jgi:hypothetical protein
MSTDYCGVVMYGVAESWLTHTDKTDSFYDIIKTTPTNEFCVTVLTSDNHEIPVELWLEISEDENYFGFLAGYPWEFNKDNANIITPQIVEQAISQFLEPYGYKPEKIKSKIDYISTYNYC